METATVETGVREETAVAPPSLRVSVETVTDEAGLENLKNEWNELVENSAAANVFLTWEWMSTWWRHFGRRARLQVLAMREAGEGRLVGLLPLLRRRQPLVGGPVRELAFLGGGAAAADHLDLIARRGYEQPVVDAAIATLKNSLAPWDVLRLEGFCGESELVRSLREAQPSGRVLQWESPCPYLPLPDDWETFFSGLDRKLRNNLRRRERRLAEEADGKVSFHQVAEAEELQPALADLFELHRQVRDSQGEAGSFAGETMQAFHRELAQRFLETGRLRLYRLRAGERTIAAGYCFCYGRTVSFYQTGYDREFSRYGPGAAIVLFAIRRAIEEGATTFDFLRGNHPYKSQWTDLEQNDVNFRLAATMRGKAYLTGYGWLRKAWKTWKARREHEGGR